MVNTDHPGPTQLAHLEHLAVNVAGVLAGSKSVAEIVCSFVVSEHLNGLAGIVAQVDKDADGKHEFDGAVRKGNQLRFA